MWIGQRDIQSIPQTHFKLLLVNPNHIHSFIIGKLSQTNNVDSF